MSLYTEVCECALLCNWRYIFSMFFTISCKCLPENCVYILYIYIQYREKICELSGLFFEGEKKSFASENCVVSIAPIP